MFYRAIHLLSSLKDAATEKLKMEKIIKKASVSAPNKKTKPNLLLIKLALLFKKQFGDLVYSLGLPSVRSSSHMLPN